MTFLKYASFNFTRDRLSTKDQMSNDYVKCRFSRGKKKIFHVKERCNRPSKPLPRSHRSSLWSVRCYAKIRSRGVRYMEKGQF